MANTKSGMLTISMSIPVTTPNGDLTIQKVLDINPLIADRIKLLELEGWYIDELNVTD